MLRLAIISDELDDDLGRALDGCERLGLPAVELRKVAGRSFLDLSDEDAAAAVGAIRERGLAIAALATPVLKCSLPGAPGRAGALHGARAEATLDDQWPLLDRALALAARHGIPFVRIFSGWRVEDPRRVFDDVAAIVREALRRAERSGVELLLENEHDCNVATAAETRALLDAVPGLRVIWDPGNHVRAGGAPAQAGLPGAEARIAHVHVKDVDAEGRWVPLGTGRVPVAAFVQGLLAAGYDGVFSLETHCRVDGSVERASEVALAVLRDTCAVPA